MKRIILTIAALGALLACLTAGAQSYYPVTMYSGAVFAESATTNLNATIDCRKTENVALMLSFKLMGTATDDVTVIIDKGVDGTTWPTATTERSTLVVAATSGTTATIVTNLAAKGYGYMRLVSVQNAAAEKMTNVVIKYSLKQLTAK